MNKKFNFSRNYRLINKAEYKNVLEDSYKINQRYVLALFKPNQKSYSRLGVIVSKRVAHRAVTRNKIKRIVRESFRLNQDLLAGLDIVVIARQHSDSVDKAKLREGMKRLWEKLIAFYQTFSS